MATKRYVDAVQRAFDEEISNLRQQQNSSQSQSFGAVAPPAVSDTNKERAYGSAPGAAPTSIAPLPSAPLSSAPPPSAPFPQAAAPTATRGVAPPAKKAAPTQAEMVAGLDVRVARLTQVRDWISEDGDIARLIDSVIGRQVSVSERRQARFSIILNVIFLFGGWALSLISTPAILGKLFNLH